MEKRHGLLWWNALPPTFHLHPGSCIKWTVDGGEQELLKHPFLTFWRKANPLHEFSTAALWRLFEIYVLLKGEGYFIIERDSVGCPLELWPVPVHWVQMTPYEGHPSYTVRTTAGLLMEVPVDDIFLMKDLNPYEPYLRGLGQSEALADEVEIDEYAAKFQKNFFINDGTPGTIISMPSSNPEQRERFLSDWADRFSGVRNSHKVSIVKSDNITVQKLGDNMKDMDMIQGRVSQRNAVLEHYGVPREIMGITESSNRATSEAAQFIYAQNVLMPKLRRREEAINTQLIPLFGDDLVWRFDDIVPRNQEFDKAKALEAYNAGLLTKNEARKLLDLDETENGNVFKTTFSDVYISEEEDPAEISLDMAQLQFADLAAAVEAKPSSSASEPPAEASTPNSVEGGTEAAEIPESASQVAVASEVSLNGAQISSLIAIVQAANAGELSYDSAVEIIMSALPFDKGKAVSILGEPESIDKIGGGEKGKESQSEPTPPLDRLSKRRQHAKSCATSISMDAARKTESRAFESTVTRYFREQGKRLVSSLSGLEKAERTVWDKLRDRMPEQEWQDGGFVQLAKEERTKLVSDFILDLVDWEGEEVTLMGLLAPLWRSTYSKGAEVSQTLYHLEGINRPELVDLAKLRGGQRVAAINQTTKNSISRIVSNALETGETNLQIARKIEAEMNTTTQRAKTIAAQECNASLIKGSHDMMATAGAKKKTWHVTNPKVARDSHLALDNITVDMDKPFKTKRGVELMVPCDPSCTDASEVVNCHCWLTYDDI